MSDKIDNTEETWNYTPLSEPIPITEQVWPEGTVPLVCTKTFTYNHENYIRECIEGILMQKTTFPVRVCIHDDASTDKTASIVRVYQEKYPNLIWVYYQKENSYRNKHKHQMRKEFMDWSYDGKYQALCEGDDYWIDPLKLQKQVSILESNKNVGAVFTDASYYFQEKKKFIHSYDATRKKNIPTGKVFNLLFKGNPYKTCTLIFRTSLLKHYKVPRIQIIMGDKFLILTLAKYSLFEYIEDTTSVYRILANSASHFTTLEGHKRWAKNSYKLSLYAKDTFNIQIAKSQLKHNARLEFCKHVLRSMNGILISKFLISILITGIKWKTNRT